MAFDSRILCLLVLTCVTATCAVNLQTTLQCFIRTYTFHAKKSTIYGECWDDINVYSCWGRCDSNEIADFKNPYRLSHQSVCTYGGFSKRLVRLSHCDPGYPERHRYYVVMDATSCVCQPCDPDKSSCEPYNG